MKKKNLSKERKKDDVKNEDLGVHIISKQDSANHFGVSKPNETKGQLATNFEKVVVNLQLDKQVWQLAELEANRLGMKLSDYLELALDWFRLEDGKPK